MWPEEGGLRSFDGASNQIPHNKMEDLLWYQVAAGACIFVWDNGKIGNEGESKRGGTWDRD